MLNDAMRSAVYAGLIRNTAQPIDPETFYCPHGAQWHDCAECEAVPTYQGSDPSRYVQITGAK